MVGLLPHQCKFKFTFFLYFFFLIFNIIGSGFIRIFFFWIKRPPTHTLKLCWLMFLDVMLHFFTAVRCYVPQGGCECVRSSCQDVSTPEQSTSSDMMVSSLFTNSPYLLFSGWGCHLMLWLFHHFAYCFLSFIKN